MANHTTSKQNLIHAISKQDNSHHAVFPVTSPLSTPLAPNSIRIRTTLIFLSSNNLTYACLGDALGWWSTYPMPPSPIAPPPYNDSSAWGIVPAWGYATVEASTIDALPAGTELYGYWPTTSTATDLQLVPAPDGAAGHWVETSPHRQGLMRMYNRYIEQPIARGKDCNDVAAARVLALRTAFKPLWECGYLNSRYVYPDPSSSTITAPPVHPFGVPGLPWTAQDADLRKAVAVSLSATSKTGRGFAWNLLRDRAPGSGPLALLQATSAPGVVKTFAEGEGDDGTPPNKAVGYEELGGAAGVGWVLGFRPEKVVVFDFGTRPGVLEGFLEALKKEKGGEAVQVSVVAVGHEMKVYSEADMKAGMESMEKFQKVQFNTSPVRDRAIEIEGGDAYFAKMNEAWKRCEEEGGLGEFETVWLDGVEGIEKVWQDLCEQKVKPSETVIVRV
ncbi:hypothetical protein DBV05_g758 [Lasiodiplodia theobromae]|uniref:Uncharacterized protein n=1 Tax=Lasiodiplodia theobromae TaxID=45133 RepID=A0A5N5DRX1_9PEZI|nr:hypothetical protein DBV05_g758 [Lasiodiplodia theobromae]